MPFFLMEEDGVPLGFFVVKQLDSSAADLFLIYVDLNHLGLGIGKSCIQFIEKWLPENWPEIKDLIRS